MHSEEEKSGWFHEGSSQVLEMQGWVSEGLSEGKGSADWGNEESGINVKWW